MLYIAIKNGGLSKPKGFEFPEERILRKRKEKLEIELRVHREMEELEKQALELEIKKQFKNEIENPKTLKELVNKYKKSKSFIPSTLNKKSIIEFEKNGEQNLLLKDKLLKYYLREEV